MLLDDKSQMVNQQDMIIYRRSVFGHRMAVEFFKNYSQNSCWNSSQQSPSHLQCQLEFIKIT